MDTHPHAKRCASQNHLASHPWTRLALAELVWDGVQDVVDCLQQVLEGGKRAGSSIIVLIFGFVHEGTKPALSGHQREHKHFDAPRGEEDMWCVFA